MASTQLRVGALRDFSIPDRYVYLVQQGQANHLSSHAQKTYLVYDTPKSSFYSQDGDLICRCDQGTNYHFDSFEEAQAKYLELADEYGAALKVQEWTPSDWHPNS